MGKSRAQLRRNGTTPDLLPIELALLEILPDEGQMLGFKPIALNVSSILARPEFKRETGNLVAGRLRSLNFRGFTVPQVTLPVQKGLGWQRTPAGKAAFEKAKKGVVKV